jgi:hypothetical protein
VCENIKVVASDSSYNLAMLNAMTICKNRIMETESVFRDPEECHDDDWFLAHSDCEISPGGGQIHGVFLFRRFSEESVYHVDPE